MSNNVIKLSVSALLLVFLTGCTISGPGIKIRPPITIEGGGGPGHCPPGQAKKGNC